MKNLVLILILFTFILGCQKSEQMEMAEMAILPVENLSSETQSNPNILYITTGNKVIMAGDTQLEFNSDYIIECIGPCDCSVRFNILTGVIDCTCNPCQMKVTQIQ